MELTTENMGKMLAWQQKGSRQVHIKIDDVQKHVWEDSGPVSVWCADYDIGTGLFIKEIDELPTVEELKALKTKRLKEELDRLEPFEMPERMEM